MAERDSRLQAALDGYAKFWREKKLAGISHLAAVTVAACPGMASVAPRRGSQARSSRIRRSRSVTPPTSSPWHSLKHRSVSRDTNRFAEHSRAMASLGRGPVRQAQGRRPSYIGLRALTSRAVLGMVTSDARGRRGRRAYYRNETVAGHLSKLRRSAA